jgi:non-ribosomal peptide synthase protein (TIGR01720 family)
VNGHFVLNQPPLFRFFLFTFSADESHLVMIACHLLFDITSCRILLEDLLSGYMQTLLGQNIHLPALTASPIHWRHHLEKTLPRVDFTDDYAYWDKVKKSKHATLPLKQAFQKKLNVEIYRKDYRLSLNSDITKTLLASPEPMHHILITAIYNTLTKHSSNKQITLTTTGHGRFSQSSPLFQHHSLSRSIGWFNSLYPLTLNSESPIAEQLQDIPHEGIHFLLLKHSCERELPEQSNIFFNYMGHLDALENKDAGMHAIELPIKLPISADENSLGYELSIDATLYQKELHICLSYSSELLEFSTIEGFSESLKKEITKQAPKHPSAHT